MNYVVRYYNQYEDFEYKHFQTLKDARKWTKEMIECGGGASNFDIFNRSGKQLKLPNYRII